MTPAQIAVSPNFTPIVCYTVSAAIAMAIWYAASAGVMSQSPGIAFSGQRC